MRANETRGLTNGDVNDRLEILADNRQAVESAISEALAKGLEAVGLAAEAYAKALCPVDTGRLRNSITHQLDIGIVRKAVYIGTNVEYAPYVESREDVRHETDRAHFLQDAATEHGDKYRQIIEAALRND